MSSRSEEAALHLRELVGWSGKLKYLPDWDLAERVLGTGLPNDYKALLRVVPAGKYGGSVLVGPPTATGHVGDLAYTSRQVFETMRTVRDAPYSMFPKLPGLLPWAECYRGSAGCLFWLVDDGDPDEWPVVLADSTYERWEQFDVGAVRFLTEFVTGALPSRILPPDPTAPRYRTFQDLEGAPNNTGN